MMWIMTVRQPPVVQATVLQIPVRAVIFDWGGTLTPWHMVDHVALWREVCALYFAGSTRNGTRRPFMPPSGSCGWRRNVTAEPGD
jgi:hypothetical protein